MFSQHLFIIYKIYSQVSILFLILVCLLFLSLSHLFFARSAYQRLIHFVCLVLYFSAVLLRASSLQKYLYFITILEGNCLLPIVFKVFSYFLSSPRRCCSLNYGFHCFCFGVSCQSYCSFFAVMFYRPPAAFWYFPLALFFSAVLLCSAYIWFPLYLP